MWNRTSSLLVWTPHTLRGTFVAETFLSVVVPTQSDRRKETMSSPRRVRYHPESPGSTAADSTSASTASRTASSEE